MERVRNKRIALGWTQKQFAEFFEIPLQTYKQWETGARKPPEYIIKLLLNATQSI